MAIQWTGKLEKECSLTYKNEGMQAAIDKFGLSRNQIKARMHELGVRTNAKKKHDQRKWYAEDVADIMESISSIGHELTAKFYNVTVRLIKKLVCNANRYGFDAYPLRNES